MVTRIVSGTLPDLEKLGDDMLLEIIFSNNGFNVDPGVTPELYPILSILLTIKNSDTGEILLQGSDWTRNENTHSYYLYASLSDSSLQQILGTDQSLSLIGEIQWVQANPFYDSANANIGPETLRISSQNFNLRISGDIG